MLNGSLVAYVTRFQVVRSVPAGDGLSLHVSLWYKNMSAGEHVHSTGSVGTRQGTYLVWRSVTNTNSRF